MSVAGVDRSPRFLSQTLTEKTDIDQVAQRTASAGARAYKGEVGVGTLSFSPMQKRKAEEKANTEERDLLSSPKKPRTENSPAGPRAPHNSPAVMPRALKTAADFRFPPLPLQAAPKTPAASASVSASSDAGAFFDLPAPAQPVKSRFFSDSPASQASDGSASSAAASPALPKELSATKTPVMLREAVELLASQPMDSSLDRAQADALHEGINTLMQMAKSPSRTDKAFEVAQRALGAGFHNLTGGAAPGSGEFHRAAVKALANAEPWSQQVLPELCSLIESHPKHADAGSGAGVQVPTSIWDEEHNTTAAKKGGSIIGLHLLPSEKEVREKLDIHSEVISCSNGVVGLHFSFKDDKDVSPKFSSCFPKGMFSSFEEVRKIADVSQPLARTANRKLVQFNVNGQILHVEILMKFKGMLRNSIYPFFVYFKFTLEKEYPIFKGLTLSSEAILKLSVAALQKASLNVKSAKSPLRYLVITKQGPELVLDLAPQLFADTKIPQGIMVQIPKSEFAFNAAILKLATNVITQLTSQKD